MEKLRLSLCQQRGLDKTISISGQTLAHEDCCLGTRGFFQLTKEGLICLFITKWFAANITRILHTLVYYWLILIYELSAADCVSSPLFLVIPCLKLSAQGWSACITWHLNINVAIVVLTTVKSGWGKPWISFSLLTWNSALLYIYTHLGLLCLFLNEGRCKNTWCSLKKPVTSSTKNVDLWGESVGLLIWMTLLL